MSASRWVVLLFVSHVLSSVMVLLDAGGVRVSLFAVTVLVRADELLMLNTASAFNVAVYCRYTVSCVALPVASVPPSWPKVVVKPLPSVRVAKVGAVPAYGVVRASSVK